MKTKIIALLLILITLCATACGSGSLPAEPEAETRETAKTEPATEAEKRAVPVVFRRQSYTFDHSPSVDEMRAMAVKYMEDLLSVQWYMPYTVEYELFEEQKSFTYLEGRLYAGLPYTAGGSGLFQWLEYYDPETGMLTYPSKTEMPYTLGTVCGGGPAWALAAVCTGFRCKCASQDWVLSQGILPLGDVTYPADIADFDAYPTTRIVEENGQAKVYAAYAQAQPADVLASCPKSGLGAHTMMVKEAPKVVYNADGSIDGAASTMVIMDQRAGDGGKFTEVQDNGETAYYSGRLSATVTFESLYKSAFIAVTVPEFTGARAFEAPSVTVESEVTDKESLRQATVLSNRPMAVVRLVTVKPDGTETVMNRKLFRRDNFLSGEAYAFPLDQFAAAVRADKGTTVKIEAVTADGATFTPVFFTVG